MRIRHARITLELHHLQQGQGPALLLLHALYGSSADWGNVSSAWPGPVYALDFSGHGRSDRLLAGGYSPELLVADADCALAHIGHAVLAGAGLGAYVALLLAGARRDTVPAALLLPGAGLAGGGALPDFESSDVPFRALEAAAQSAGPYDPLVRVLDQDVRPTDYVEPFGRAARKILLVEDHTQPPPWWQVVRQGPNTEVALDVNLALAQLYAKG